MKRSFIAISIISLFIACSPGDKKEELEKLKQEREQLNEKITALEKEVGVQKEEKVIKVKNVAVTPVKPQSFKHYIEIQGKVDSDENLTLTSKTMGVVTRINVKAGDEVKQGQVLAELDNQVALQGLSEIENQLQFANNLYQKQKNLWDQKIGTEVQYLSAKNNKEALEKKMATISQQVEMSKIKSPISGTVDEVMLKIGQNSAPGMPAVRVVNFKGLKVKAEVAESYGAKIKTGNPVIITFPDLNKEVESKVTFSSKVINTLTRSFTVEALLPSNSNEYRPNMLAILKIADYNVDQAIVAPINTVQKTEDGSFVFIAINGGGKKIASRKKVETGNTYNGMVEIKSGLSSGDMLITTGYQDLNNGEAVTF